MTLEEKPRSHLPHWVWRAVLAPRWDGRSLGEGARLLAWTAGLAQCLIGLVMAVTPAQFEGTAYAAFRAHLALNGILFCGLGLLLLTWQVLPLERARIPTVSLLLSTLGCAWIALGFSRTGAWMDTANWGLIGLSLVAVTVGGAEWLETRFGVDLFMLMVMLDRLLIGILLLLGVSPVAAAIDRSLGPHPQLWSLGMLVTVLALGTWQIRRDRTSRILLAIVAAVPMLAWTNELGVLGNLTAALILSGLLTAGVVARSFLPAARSPGQSDQGELFQAIREMGERLEARTRERDRVEETLRESEERYRTIVEMAQEGIWILDADGETTFVNAKMAEMLMSSVEAMLGRSLFSFVDATQQAAAHDLLERWRIGVAGQQEVKLRRTDGGELWVLISANPLSDREGDFTGAMALVTNVTNRKRGEEERARLLEREQAAREEVEALLAATASLGVQAEPDEVVQTLVAQAAGLLDARSATYAIRQGDVLVIQGRWIGDAWIHGPYELPISGSIFGHVWSTGAPYRSNQLGTDPFVNLERLATTGHTSMLAAPLCAPDGEQLGCVAAFDSRRPSGFSERDERLLTAVCETGATILLRAREETALLQAERAAARRKQEVEALLSAADRLNSAVDSEEVLLSVVGVAGELLAVSRVSIATNEGDHALRRYTWLDGAWHSTQTPLPLETSLSGWVIKHGRPYRSDDFRNAELSYVPAWVGQAPSTTLAVPILARDGHVLGSLNLFDRRDGQPFSDDDQRLAEGIAHHAAVALERATLTAELRRSQEQLKQQVFSDALTGLPNRPLFLDRLSRALTVARRRAGGVAVLFLDLDGFKLVNDSLGHAAGDELLVAVANRLATAQRVEDTVARFGGDEFAVLLENLADAADAKRAAERILAELRRPFHFRRREIVVTGSIGIALTDDRSGQSRPEDLLREADIALYQAKAAGKAQAVVFDQSMSAQALERLDLETSLRRAVERSELRLYYQPIVKLESGIIVGAEALVRWQHPERGLLEPDAFIPLAEETGLILPLGRWVLQEACLQARAWQRYGRDDLPFRMSVNLSARQFEQADLVSQVVGALEEARLLPAGLELEITESAVIQKAEATGAMLGALKDAGVRLAIDDFGTGYSSLSYLQRLSVDTLKIDRSFTDGLRREQSTAAIVQAIIVMAHALAIEVTGEGIETVDQLGFLRVLGCDYGQGYFLSKPVPAAAFESLLSQPLPG